MNEFYQLWLTYILAFAVLSIMPLFFINFFTQGFLAKWLAVRISRGRKFLIVLDGVRNDKYFTGKEENEMIVFKDYKKETRRMALSKDCIRKGWGLDYIIVNDAKNAVMKINFDAVSGFDAEKNNSLFLRALYKPALVDRNLQIILVLLVLVVIGLLYLAYANYAVGGKIDALAKMIDLLKTPTAQAATNVLTSGGA